MAVWSQAQYFDVIARGRMDGEYHSHDGGHVESRLVRSGIELTRLRDCCDRITSGHTPLRHDLTRGEVFFITVECVSPLLIDYSLSKRVRSIHYSGELNRVALAKDSVVVTIKRRIAQASPCYNLKGDTVVNQDVAVLRLKNGWNPGYIAAYLISNVGQKLADRERTEQMNPYLPVNKLSNLLVPRINIECQRNIDELVKERFKCLGESEKAYSQAQNLLESELGLDKLKFKKPVGYTARFSDTLTNGRFDADYYHPQFAATQQTVKNYPNGYEPLSSIAAALKPNIDPAQAPNQLYNYIELSNINPTLGTVDGFGTMLGKDLPSRARRQVINGDVLASAVVGSVDKAAIIDAAQNGFLASTGFFHFRPISVSSEYLLVLVKSKCVCMQFQQQSTGGILSAVPDSRLRNIIVPKLPDKLQQKIRDLVLQSHRAKKRSQELLSQAKARVEQLIEEAAAQ